jgi:capsular polysaccharide transport system permease protein
LVTRIAAFSRGLGSQLDVIVALILRETRTRFGRNRLGYLWALVEPIVVTFTFYAVLLVAGRATPPGMGMFGFIATGVLPYTLFSNTVTRVSDAVSSNKALLYYPQVRPLDLVIARALLEAATFVAVFILVMGADALIARRLDLDSSLQVIGGLAIASAVGTTLGLIFCGLGQVSSSRSRSRPADAPAVLDLGDLLHRRDGAGGSPRRIAVESTASQRRAHARRLVREL